MNEETLDLYVKTYLNCAEWVRFDTDEKRRGFSKQAKELAKSICLDFINKVKAEFTESEAKAILELEGRDVHYSFPHDLYLTIHHHGSGFWDGNEWDEIAVNGGERLTRLAHEIQEHEIYVGNGGWIYF